jgi:hypothetical protein
MPQLSGKKRPVGLLRSMTGAERRHPTRPGAVALPRAARPRVTSGYGRRSPFTHAPPQPNPRSACWWRRRHSRFIYLFIFHSSPTDGYNTSPPAWAAQSHRRGARAAMPCTETSGSVALCLHGTEHFYRLREGSSTRVLLCRVVPRLQSDDWAGLGYSPSAPHACHWKPAGSSQGWAACMPAYLQPRPLLG